MRRLSLLLAALVVSSSAAGAQKTGPSGATYVKLEAGGNVLGIGHSVSGLVATQPTMGMRAGNAAGRAASHSLPGPSKGPEITIGGIPQSQSTPALMQWAAGAQPRDVLLTIVKPDGTPEIQYLLRRAIPTKLTVGPLNAGSAEVQTTSLTLATEGVTVLGATGP